MNEKLKEALNYPILLVKFLDWSYYNIAPETKEITFNDIEVIKNKTGFSIIFKDFNEWLLKNKFANYEIIKITLRN